MKGFSVTGALVGGVVAAVLLLGDTGAAYADTGPDTRGVIGGPGSGAAEPGNGPGTIVVDRTKGGGKGKGNTICAHYASAYRTDMKTLDDAHASGNQDAINAARNEVNVDILIGYQHGCRWVP
jgi:hypothetical protein